MPYLVGVCTGRLGPSRSRPARQTLASLLKRAAPRLRLNEHIEADGPTVFAHACKMGLDGIVSKRMDSRYRSSRSADWLQSKNPALRCSEGRAGGRLATASAFGDFRDVLNTPRATRWTRKLKAASSIIA